MQYDLSVQPSESGKIFLREESVLNKLDATSFEQIYGELEWLKIDAGKTLFEEGSAGDSLFILVSGHLGAFVSAPNAGRRMVGEIYPGESIGEMSVLTEEKRSATVLSFRVSILVRLSSQNFRKLIEQNPTILMMVNQILIERLRDSFSNHPKRNSHAKIIAVFPASQHVSLHLFCQKLTLELARWGRVLHLSSPLLKTQLGNLDIQNMDHESYARLVAWIHEQEHEHDYIVLESDLQKTEWTQFCMDHTDSTLLVANANQKPGGFVIDERYRQKRSDIGPRRKLVLLHSKDTPLPNGTRYWLQKLPTDSHHHVRLECRRDMTSLARYLTGNTISLALSGGAALGMAHIGIIRALQEYGVPIDLACGASTGSNLSALVACEWSYQKIWEEVRKAFPQRIFYDVNIPMLSLLRTKLAIGALKKVLGEIHIEDMWRPYFCSSSNLTRVRTELHTEGLAWKQILASGSLPGVYPPSIAKSGDLLVDGAVLSNLPALHVRDFCEGKIIAVNVIPSLDTNICYGLPESSSAMELLLGRINPLKRAYFPSIFDVMMRSIFLNSIRDAEHIRQEVDLYIEPTLDKFSFFNLKPFDPIVKQGYHFARPLVEDWIDKDPIVQKIIQIERLNP